MSENETTAEPNVEWNPQPAAARLVVELFEAFCRSSCAARALRQRMRDETGTRLFDWVDHLVFPRDLPLPSGEGRGEGYVLAARLAETGFEQHEDAVGTVWTHGRGLFPPVVLSHERARRLAVKVDSVFDFV